MAWEDRYYDGWELACGCLQHDGCTCDDEDDLWEANIPEPSDDW